MSDTNKAGLPTPEEHESLQQLRRTAARFVHDASTPLLTLRALTTSIPESDETSGLKKEIEKQITRLSERIDLFWQQANPQLAAQDNTPQEPGLPGTVAETHLRILLIDDDAIHRDVGCRLLTQMGHTVTPCAEIDEVEARGPEAPYDILFLDQYCSGMLGSNIMKQQLLSHLSGSPPWTIGMSADPRTEEIRALCLNAGMQDYLEKPITRDKLEVALNRAARHLQRHA